MTTQAQVRAAWTTSVFDDAAIAALTPNRYDYELSIDSQSQASDARDEGEVNYFSYTIKRFRAFDINSIQRQFFQVDIKYYLEIIPDGSNYNIALDAFETIDNLVKTVLGETWSGLVLGYDNPVDVPFISEVLIDNSPSWVVETTYTAQEKDDL